MLDFNKRQKGSRRKLLLEKNLPENISDSFIKILKFFFLKIFLQIHTQVTFETYALYNCYFGCYIFYFSKKRILWKGTPVVSYTSNYINDSYSIVNEIL